MNHIGLTIIMDDGRIRHLESQNTLAETIETTCKNFLKLKATLCAGVYTGHNLVCSLDRADGYIVQVHHMPGHQECADFVLN